LADVAVSAATAAAPQAVWPDKSMLQNKASTFLSLAFACPTCMDSFVSSKQLGAAPPVTKRNSPSARNLRRFVYIPPKQL